MIGMWEDWEQTKKEHVVRWVILAILVLAIVFLFWQLLISKNTITIKEEKQSKPAALLMIDQKDAYVRNYGGDNFSRAFSGMLLGNGDELIISNGGKLSLDFFNGDRLVSAGSINNGNATLSINRLAQNEQNLALTEELSLGEGQHWLRMQGVVHIGGAKIMTSIKSPKWGGSGVASSSTSKVASDELASRLSPGEGSVDGDGGDGGSGDGGGDGGDRILSSGSDNGGVSEDIAEQAVFSVDHDLSTQTLQIRMFNGSIGVSGDEADGASLPIVAGESLTWFTDSPITNADVSELAMPLSDWERENILSEQELLYQQALTAENENQKQGLAKDMLLNQAYLNGEVAQAREISGISGRSAVRKYMTLFPKNEFDFSPTITGSDLKNLLAGKEGGLVSAGDVGSLSGISDTGKDEPRVFSSSVAALSIEFDAVALSSKNKDPLLAIWYFLPMKTGGAIYIEEIPLIGHESYQLVFPNKAKPPFFPESTWPVGEYSVKVLQEGAVLSERRLQVISS